MSYGDEFFGELLVARRDTCCLISEAIAAQIISPCECCHLTCLHPALRRAESLFCNLRWFCVCADTASWEMAATWRASPTRPPLWQATGSSESSSPCTMTTGAALCRQRFLCLQTCMPRSPRGNKMPLAGTDIKYRSGNLKRCSIHACLPSASQSLSRATGQEFPRSLG